MVTRCESGAKRGKNTGHRGLSELVGGAVGGWIRLSVSRWCCEGGGVPVVATPVGGRRGLVGVVW